MKSELIKKIEKIGSLNDMNQAVRLITNLGYRVTNWDNYTIWIEGHEAIKFEERSGKIWMK